MSALRCPEPVDGQPPRLAHLPTTGPALTSIDVPGIPQAQGSLKAVARGRGVVVIHDNPRLRPCRDLLAWRAREALVGRPAALGPIAIALEIRLTSYCVEIAREVAREHHWRHIEAA